RRSPRGRGSGDPELQGSGLDGALQAPLELPQGAAPRPRGRHVRRQRHGLLRTLQEPEAVRRRDPLQLLTGTGRRAAYFQRPSTKYQPWVLWWTQCGSTHTTPTRGGTAQWPRVQTYAWPSQR